MKGAVILIALAAAWADDAEERQRQADVARLAPVMAKRLEIIVHDPAPAKADLHDEPLLRWSNPTAGSVYGEVFLWTVDGRPAAIASIYRWYHPFTGATVEFTSLDEPRISAREGDVLRWDSQTPGLTFRPLSDVREPPASPVLRLSHMKALARSFSAELTDKRGGEAVRRRLRLLNQPVHRYEAPTHSVVDGAIFAFVEGTDPEAWLVLEAVEEEEALVWRYGLARMNADAVDIRHSGGVVESWPPSAEPWRDRQAPYRLFTFEPDLIPSNDQESP